MRFFVTAALSLFAAVQVLASSCCSETCMITTVQQSFSSNQGLQVCYRDAHVDDL